MNYLKFWTRFREVPLWYKMKFYLKLWVRIRVRTVPLLYKMKFYLKCWVRIRVRAVPLLCRMKCNLKIWIRVRAVPFYRMKYYLKFWAPVRAATLLHIIKCYLKFWVRVRAVPLFEHNDEIYLLFISNITSQLLVCCFILKQTLEVSVRQHWVFFKCSAHNDPLSYNTTPLLSTSSRLIPELLSTRSD